MRLCALAVCFVFGGASLFATITLSPESGVSGTVTPESIVTVKAVFSPDSTPTASLHRLDGKSTDTRALAVKVVDDKTISVKLPVELALGAYYLTLNDGTSDVTVPGSMTVSGEAVKLDSVHPATQYKGTKDLFNFDLVGDNFSPVPENDDVWIAGQGSIVNSRGTEAQCQDLPKPCLWVQNANRMHIVGYKAEPSQGPVMVSVRVGGTPSRDEKRLMLAKMSGTAIMLWSLAVTALLFLAVSWLVSGGLKGYRVGNRVVGMLQAFILDPETNSYSLSKFQLLAFSITFIFGYLYVLLSRWLVQWQFVLPDVPSTVAGLLGISAGTTVASAGLTSARGSKGAGLQHPTGADLIASGGVVVPERFQFFVWTIIACGGFAALLIGQDPATVTDFPTFPDGLLYVMGVSAAGYLGGKATRKPGPVIHNVALDMAKASAPVLIVQGQNLSTDGGFYIDGKALPIAPDSVKAQNQVTNLLDSTPQEGASDTHFCTELKITILSLADVDLTQGEHRFRIVNKDGQFADVVVTANPPRIVAVVPDAGADIDDSVTAKALPARDSSTAVIVAGIGLVPGSTATWQGQPIVIQPVTSAAGKRLRTTLVPGKAGTGLLVVTTPSGFAANATVTVGDAPAPQPAPVPPVAPVPPAGPVAPVPPVPPAEPPVTTENSAPAQGAQGEGPGGSPAPAQGPGMDEVPTG